MSADTYGGRKEMAITSRPEVNVLADGGKTWEIANEKFVVKGYIPANKLNGAINNYSFMAPLLIVLEENKQTMEEAVKFADSTGLAGIAAKSDCGVLFVYPLF